MEHVSYACSMKLIMKFKPQLNSKGVLEVRPDFNSDRGPYRIESLGHDVFEYVLEHCSIPIDHDTAVLDVQRQQGEFL